MLTEPDPTSRQIVSGRILTAGGTAGLVWLLLSQWTDGGAGWRLPIAPALWGVCCLGVLILGIAQMWHRSHPRNSWKPDQPGKRFNSLVVYTRPGCHLCEEAMVVLSEYRDWLPAPVEVDIDQDDSLQEKYDTTVPVVEFDGTVRFWGEVNPLLLRRLINGTSPLASLRTRPH